MKRIFSTVMAMFMLCLTLTSFMPVTSYAAGDCSLRIEFLRNGKAITDVNFNLYRVAELSDPDGTDYQLTEKFKDYPVSLDDLDNSDNLASLALTFSGYVGADNIEADADGITNKRGIAIIGNLEPGLYLVLGDSVTVGNRTYTSVPFLVFLPSEIDGKKYNTVTVDPKYTYEDKTEETIDITVRKVWADGKGKYRPTSIRARLLCDGESYAEVTLNKKNNWSYTWKGLEPNHTWNVTEVKVPKGYRVSVSQGGYTFTIKNKIRPGYSPDEPYNRDDPSSSEESSEGWSEEDEDGSRGSVKPGKGKLPQTGQMWWPVFALVGVGVFMFASGMLMVRSKETEEVVVSEDRSEVSDE